MAQGFAATSGIRASGTPANDQVGVWTGAAALEGTSGLTYDGTTFAATGDISASDQIFERGRSTALGEFLAKPTFAAGDYVASGGGGAETWTVASGDEGGTNRRMALVGKTATMVFHLVDTDVSGSPVTLEILLPNSVQVGVNGFGTFRYKSNGVYGSGYWIASTGSPTKLLLRKIDDSAWATGTGNNDFQGTAIFGIA